MPVNGEKKFEIGKSNTFSLEVFKTAKTHQDAIHVHYKGKVIAIIYDYINFIKVHHKDTNYVLINDSDNHYVYVGDEMYRFYGQSKSPIDELRVLGGEVYAYDKKDKIVYDLSTKRWSYTKEDVEHKLANHKEDLTRLLIIPHHRYS